MLYAFFWGLNFIYQRFRTLCLFHLHRPMKMEQTECSETSVYKIQTPENYPEESLQHSEHSESLKSRKNAITGRRILQGWTCVCIEHTSEVVPCITDIPSVVQVNGSGGEM